MTTPNQHEYSTVKLGRNNTQFVVYGEANVWWPHRQKNITVEAFLFRLHSYSETFFWKKATSLQGTKRLVYRKHLYKGQKGWSSSLKRATPEGF